MTLSTEEAKRLNAALLSAYQYDSLQRMLFFELGKHLHMIAAPGTFQAVVFSVITTAEMEGWTDDLVHAAHDANPGNPLLKRFTEQYVRFQGAKPSLERLIEKTNSFLDVAAWRKRLERLERQVCSIEIGGKHMGTGFLIAHNLVVTNYHVVASLLGETPAAQARAGACAFRLQDLRRRQPAQRRRALRTGQRQLAGGRQPLQPGRRSG
ncbi:MAG: effector-associated domain EAD1-containing protein [Caldilineaceae bacterium]